MKLPIKKKYFDDIKIIHKTEEYRDAHITFICEETGETLVKKVVGCRVEHRPRYFYTDVLSDENMIIFELED